MSSEPLSVLPEQLARSQKMVVFDRDAHTLKVASSLLLSDTVIASLSQKTGLNVETYLATDEAIERALRSYRHDLEQMIKNLLAPHSGVLNDAPIANIVDLLIMLMQFLMPLVLTKQINKVLYPLV